MVKGDREREREGEEREREGGKKGERESGREREALNRTSSNAKFYGEVTHLASNPRHYHGSTQSA